MDRLQALRAQTRDARDPSQLNAPQDREKAARFIATPPTAARPVSGEPIPSTFMVQRFAHHCRRRDTCKSEVTLGQIQSEPALNLRMTEQGVRENVNKSTSPRAAFLRVSSLDSSSSHAKISSAPLALCDHKSKRAPKSYNNFRCEKEKSMKVTGRASLSPYAKSDPYRRWRCLDGELGLDVMTCSEDDGPLRRTSSEPTTTQTSKHRTEECQAVISLSVENCHENDAALYVPQRVLQMPRRSAPTLHSRDGCNDGIEEVNSRGQIAEVGDAELEIEKEEEDQEEEDQEEFI